MVILLHNPLAKNSRSKRVTKKLADYYKKKHIPFRVKSLLKIKDLEHYVKETPKNISLIILGGDGTINTFVNQTANIDFDIPVFLKKNGSGNDFLRSLLKQKASTQYIMKMTHDNEIRYFMNGSGMGIDGKIVDRVNRSKNKNRLNYLLNTLRTLLTFKPADLDVTIDNKAYKFKKVYLINANNGAYVGGGMKMTPTAKVNQKDLDVIIVHSVNKLTLMFIFFTVYLGFHTKIKRYVFYTKAQHVKAIMSVPQIAQTDGECFHDTHVFEAEVTDKTIHFRPFKKAS